MLETSLVVCRQKKKKSFWTIDYIWIVCFGFFWLNYHSEIRQNICSQDEVWSRWAHIWKFLFSFIVLFFLMRQLLCGDWTALTQRGSGQRRLQWKTEMRCCWASCHAGLDPENFNEDSGCLFAGRTKLKAVTGSFDDPKPSWWSTDEPFFRLLTSFQRNSVSLAHFSKLATFNNKDCQ